MSLADNALTTLEAVKSELNITDTTQDSKLERKVNEYSAMVESLLNRSFKKTAYTEKYAGKGRQLLVLKNYPIVSVETITLNGVTLDDWEIDDGLKSSGMILRETGWTAESYLVGLVGEPNAPKRNIEVQYTAGYVLPKDDATGNPRTLPYDIENVIIEFIAEDWNQQGSKGLKTFEVSDVKWEWITEMNPKVAEILKRYKRLVV